MWNSCLWQNSLPLLSVEEKASPESETSDFFLLHSLGTQLEDSSVSQWPKKSLNIWDTWRFARRVVLLRSWQGGLCLKHPLWLQPKGVAELLWVARASWVQATMWSPWPSVAEDKFLSLLPACFHQTKINIQKEKIGTEQYLQLKLLCFLNNSSDNKRYSWQIILL